MHVVKEKPKQPPAVSYIQQQVNRKEVQAQLGETGKYYCKSKLIGKCNCCDGYCGPTNGQNCDACMELDVKRLNLAAGYLVNPTGYVSMLNPHTKLYYCGRQIEEKKFFGVNKIKCLDGNQCTEC